MLAGSYPMSVDAKARVTLPAVFRKQLVDGDKKTIYLLPMKECVNGFTPAGLEQFIDGLFIERGENRFDPRSRRDVQLKTRLWASAVEVDIDSAGRVALGKLDGTKPGTRERLGLTAASRSWAPGTTSRCGTPSSGTRRRRASRTSSTRSSITTRRRR